MQFIKKVFFRAYDKPCVEYFSNKTDEQIYEALVKICDTFILQKMETYTLTNEETF